MQNFLEFGRGSQNIQQLPLMLKDNSGKAIQTVL
jgi:hypothetical protein